jgi:hypothetical protein
MERPTKFYPSAPKIEHFLMKPTNLKALTESASGTDNAGHSSRTEYAPLDAKQYADYLAAHRSWLSEIEATDSRLHAQSLRKRALKGWREVAEVGIGNPVETLREAIHIPGYQADVFVHLDKKVDHVPILSNQPHRAEKRANRKKVRDATTKAAADALAAKAEVIVATTAIPVVRKRLTELAELSAARPLHKAELIAAKDAAARVKQIKFGSTDLVANVAPDDGWKIVTRKKGEFRPQISTVAVDTPLPGGTFARQFAFVQQDPSAPRNSAPLSAVRQPTTTVAKS